MAGVIFNAVAEAHFEHHFDVEFCALAEAFGFEVFAEFFEFSDALVEFFTDGADCALDFVVGGDELFCWVDGDGGE